MYSKGISWINDVRIPFEDDIDLEQTTHQKTNGDKYGGGKGFHKEPIVMQMYKPQGRFPANLLVSDDMLNDGTISKGQANMTQQSSKNNVYNQIKSKGNTTINDGIKDKGTNSRYYNIDRWFEKLLEDV